MIIAQTGFKGRRRHAVTFAELHSRLSRLARAFAFPDPPPVLAPAPEFHGPLIGYTDVIAVYLSSEVAIGPRIINEWGFIRVLAHEIEHFRAGSFEFSFASPAGQKLWERLAPRRHLLKKHLAPQPHPSLTLYKPGTLELLSDPVDQKIPHLVGFLMHFRDVAAAQGLWNIIEDCRIERSLQVRYPGLAEMARLIEKYEELSVPGYESLSPAEQFCRLLLDHALGKARRSEVPEDFLGAWTAVLPIIDEYIARLDLGTVHESASITHAILDAIEKEVPEEALPEVLEVLSQNVPVPMHQILANRTLKEDEPGSFGPGQGSWPSGVEPTRPIGEGPWQAVEEWNCEAQRLEIRAVWIRERPWASWRTPKRASTRTPENNSTPVDCPWLRVEENPAAEGWEFIPDRLHDYLVAWRGGREADGRVFLPDLDPPVSLAGWNITLVIDLTASMEAPLPQADPLTPLDRAVEAIEIVVPELEYLGATASVLGFHDAGRGQGTFYWVKHATESLNPPLLRSLHAVGGGGYRIGPILRSLASKATDASARQLVVLLTDAASAYVAPTKARVMPEVVDGPCRNCASLAECWVEPLDYRTGVRKPKSHEGANQLALFRSLEYETADICYAIDAHPELAVLFVSLRNKPNPRIWDATFGPGHYVTPSAASPQETAEALRGAIVNICVGGSVVP